MNPDVLDEVYRFWFGELKGPADHPKDKAEIWFKRTDGTDAAIRDAFGPHLDAVRAAAWDLASLSRRQQVALVVMLDQFPRNILRESGDAFACDARAREIARALVDGGLDRFWLAERAFVLMPFMHSEDVADQDTCIWLFAAQARSAPDALKEGMRQALDFATRHRDIIRKFGRFPHRNEMLGRVSTPEEIEFLKDGRGF